MAPSDFFNGLRDPMVCTAAGEQFTEQAPNAPSQPDHAAKVTPPRFSSPHR